MIYVFLLLKLTESAGSAKVHSADVGRAARREGECVDRRVELESDQHRLALGDRVWMACGRRGRCYRLCSVERVDAAAGVVPCGTVSISVR